MKNISNDHFEFHAARRKGEGLKHSTSDFEEQNIATSSLHNVVVLLLEQFVDDLKPLAIKLMFVESKITSYLAVFRKFYHEDSHADFLKHCLEVVPVLMVSAQPFMLVPTHPSQTVKGAFKKSNMVSCKFGKGHD